ncbi:TM2 domain-containing protein [Hathewaya massiliensis]|uniref:TM2 domain-containing protein n=1 Tax=Hathewaya massiliensis TaxID=1964382 RepID=UPI0011574B8A|nr:TM2 domain-containing protein [Hathewaya massiliensis]
MEQLNSGNSQYGDLKYCKHCGEKIPADAVICTKCGRQVEELKTNQPNIVINNENSSRNVNANVNANINGGRHFGNPKRKSTALLLCLLFGIFGAHKFYEGKIIKGIIYFFTFGLCLVGVILDLLALLSKPSTYYV